MKPFTNTNYGNEAPHLPFYSESKRKLYLPRFYGIKEFGPPKTIKIDPGEDAPMEFTGKLKDKQLPIVKAFTEATEGRQTGGGIISVPCGYGKTVLALYLAAQMGKNTLVIVHKEFLMNQWKERIEQFLPDVKVGKIQRNVINKENCEIVIGLLQSISMIEYPEETFSGFGLVIYDECHHHASIFKSIIKNEYTFHAWSFWYSKSSGWSYKGVLLVSRRYNFQNNKERAGDSRCNVV